VRPSERGETLIEVVVACAVIAVITGAIGAALIAATHRFGPDVQQQALEQTVANEMRVAIDVAKYQGSTLAAASIATTAPLPSSSPLPIALSLNSVSTGSGAVTITITASTTSTPTKSASLTQTIVAPAPLPGSSVTSGVSGNAPQ
jgi:type II secretory pathway pseudopilin PulG